MTETAQLEVPAVKPATNSKPESPMRLVSLDAFRGLVMTLMLGEHMQLHDVGLKFPNSAFWAIIAYNTDHVEWQGCSLHDLIQPAFSFLVGAALPFSIASRKAKGETFGQMLGHAFRRALILIFLGIFLRSLRSHQTYFTFEDTLTQIGMGYVFLFLLGFARVRTQVITLLLILICFWAAFAIYPAPGPQFDYARVGVPPNWPHLYTGFLSHWNKNSNLSWAFDTWFLNLFPREQPFVFNEGGWSTLSFIPTLATMIMGAPNRRMAQGEGIKGAQTAEHGSRGSMPDPAWSHPPMGWHLPHREKSLDLVVHAVQRRLGLADSLRVLCVAGLEGLAAMGIPVGSGRNELDRCLCNGVDYAGLLQ
jgi:hypothetical protein